VTDEHDTPAPSEPAAETAPTIGPDADPRLRPPDPAGTQPKWDPDSLLPRKPAARTPGGALWDPSSTDAHDPEAEAESDVAAEDEAPERADGGVAVAAAVHERTESKYAPRFQFALGALLAVGAAAIVLLVAVLVGNGASKAPQAIDTGPSWSTWRPTANGADGPTQIAEHVGAEYRLSDGKQLVAVTGGPLQIAGLPVTVAVRHSAAQGGDIKLFDGSSGVLYRLCGLGPKCAIDSGKASTQRHLLLRREALELALYSFKYLGVDDAVVFLPPRKGQDPTQALFFRRQETDVLNAVQRPLDATLVRETPSVAGVTRSPDAQLVNTITTPKLFKFSFTQANQDTRAFLVLDPMSGG
jgi:hypothetical protein